MDIILEKEKNGEKINETDIEYINKTNVSEIMRQIIIANI